MDPRRLDVPMAQISKRKYNEAHKSPYVIASRSCGFVTEIMDKKGKAHRCMYVTHEDVYYSGVMLSWDSIESFQNYAFDGVIVEVKARFSRILQDA